MMFPEAGWRSRSARLVHTQEVAGSNPAPATMFPCALPPVRRVAGTAGPTPTDPRRAHRFSAFPYGEHRLLTGGAPWK